MFENWIFVASTEVYVKLSLVSSPNNANGLSMHPYNILYPPSKEQLSDWNYYSMLTDNFSDCSLTSTAGI